MKTMNLQAKIKMVYDIAQQPNGIKYVVTKRRVDYWNYGDHSRDVYEIRRSPKSNVLFAINDDYGQFSIDEYKLIKPQDIAQCTKAITNFDIETQKHIKALYKFIYNEKNLFKYTVSYEIHQIDETHNAETYILQMNGRRKFVITKSDKVYLNRLRPGTGYHMCDIVIPNEVLNAALSRAKERPRGA